MATSWDRRSPSEQGRVRDAVLSQWIRKAAAYSQFWADHLVRAGVAADRIDRAEQLRLLPPVRESEIAGAGGPGNPALLMRPNEEQVKAYDTTPVVFRVARSSRRAGAAGRRLALLEEYKPIHLHTAGPDGRVVIAYSRTDLDRLHRAGARAAAVLGLTDQDYLVSAVPAHGGLGFWGLYHLGLGTSLLGVHPTMDGGGLDAAARAFALVPATAVAVRPGDAMALAAAVGEAGVGITRVQTLITVGPPPTAARRAAMVEAWRSAGAARELRLQVLWAPSVARALWAECRPVERHGDDASFGLHTYPDLEVLELVDPATGRVVAGGGGDLTYTSAGWHGTAMVRYQTGDFVAELLTDPCPNCGRTVPRVAAEVVPAAWQPATRSGRGRIRIDLRGAASVLAGIDGVSVWRVELRGGKNQDEDDLVVELAGDLDEATLDRLTDSLTAAIGLPPARLRLEDAAAVRERASEHGIFADRR